MAFTCPDCLRTSHNPNDQKHRYCGACHKFFPHEIDEPADVAVLSQLVIEARTVLAQVVALGGSARHRQHWRAVIAWLQAHLPPEHSAVSETPPCGVCLDRGEIQRDGGVVEPCSCLVGQYLGDLSA